MRDDHVLVHVARGLEVQLADVALQWARKRLETGEGINLMFV